MSTLVLVRCDCSWSGRYDSQARAHYALSRHSCDKTQRDRARALRGRERDAAVDRTPKTCQHKVADHQHGTYAAYTLDGCRCPPCVVARSAYDQNRNRQTAYGRWSPYVDATPAADHLRRLSAAGMGWKRAADAAGVPQSSVYPLLYGRKDRRRGDPRTRARRQLVDAILAVPMPTVHDLGATTVIDGTGTRRRLEALIAAGWSVSAVAERGGIDRQALDSALAWVPVAAKTARAVRAVYESIGDDPPPQSTPSQRTSATRSRARAAQHGWVIPAMWDADDLDDPYAAPPAGDSGPVTLDLDEWAHLVRGGETPARAAERCGVTISAVEYAIARGDRDDVARLLRQVREAA